MWLYYITDRAQLAGSESERQRALLQRIADAARAGVDYIQLREKDLMPRELERLALDAVRRVRENSGTARLLINLRSDIALASDADGVHLPAGELPASEVRALWMKSGSRVPVIGVSAHSADDVHYAEAHGADFAVLAPIFEKVQTGAPGIGLATLRIACGRSRPSAKVEAPYQGSFPIFALGGVNLTNAGACLAAGAAGVAGIRLFQSGDIFDTVRRLRH